VETFCCLRDVVGSLASLGDAASACFRAITSNTFSLQDTTVKVDRQRKQD
jgi:hypothetical protein